MRITGDEIRTWGPTASNPPASEDTLRRCETELGHRLPDGLRSVLEVSDGIDGEHGTGLVWPAALVARGNRERRDDRTFAQLSMSFDTLVFFAEAGNGDELALSLRGSRDVFSSDHEDDSRRCFASTVRGYLETWMTGSRTS